MFGQITAEIVRQLREATVERKALLAEVDALRAELEVAESALLRKGYRKTCDIAACNCGSQWNHGGHAEQRLSEIGEALRGAGFNGGTLLGNIETVCAERDALKAEVDALRAEVARLKTVPMKYRRMEFNAQLQQENASLRAERDALHERSEVWRVAYEGACKLVADMHTAAMGATVGPALGVVEDVEALRAERDAMRGHIAKLIDLAEFWIERENRGGSDSDWITAIVGELGARQEHDDDR